MSALQHARTVAKHAALDSWYYVFGVHPFTSLQRAPAPIVRAFVRANYGSRLQHYYLASRTGPPVLFIHVPKCGGTSVGRALGRPHVPHVPAYAFHVADAASFNRAQSVAIIRDPLDRLLSILRHFGHSIFAGSDEKHRYVTLGLQDNPHEAARRYLADAAFRRELMRGTNGGRVGFTVSQVDYLGYKGQCLVQTLFILEQMPQMEAWLSDALGQPVSIPWVNKTSDSQPPLPADLVALAREAWPADYRLWEHVQAHGGLLQQATGLPLSVSS
ncbi:MAG: hypothetical protein AAF970_09780 [Bacteroidota bacterium]